MKKFIIVIFVVFSIAMLCLLIGALQFFFGKGNPRPQQIANILNERPSTLIELEKKLSEKFRENISELRNSKGEINSWELELDRQRNEKFPNVTWYRSPGKDYENVTYLVVIRTQTPGQRLADGAFTLFYIYIDRELNILGYMNE